MSSSTSVPTDVRQQLESQTYSWLFVPFLQAVYDVGDQIPGNTIERARRAVGSRRWDQMVSDSQRRLGGRGEGWHDLVDRDPDDPTREHPRGYIGAQKQVAAINALGLGQQLQEIGIELIRSGDAAKAGLVEPRAPAERRPRPQRPAAAGAGTTATAATTSTSLSGGGRRPALPPASRPRAAGGAAAAAAAAGEERPQQRGRRAQERRVAADIVRQGREIAIPELEPASEGQAPPNVHVWPLDGPGANDFIVLHAVDSHTDPALPVPRNNVVIVNASVWPPEVYVYDYRQRPLQPRWVTAGGRWLVRRTVALEPAQGDVANRAYKRAHRRWAESGAAQLADGEVVRGDMVQTAQAVRPPVQEFVDVYVSLQSMLMGGQPIRSVLFPASTTHDFPDYIASTGAGDDSLLAMSSTLQMSRGASHPWFHDPMTSPRAEFQALTTALPLARDLEQQIAAAQPPLSQRAIAAMHGARPIERPSERSYIVGITFDANNETVLVWNGHGYVRDPLAPPQQPWNARYDFQSTDLGMRVPYWSSVIDERGDCYYINAMTLRKTIPLNAGAAVAAVEPEERYGAAAPPSSTPLLFTEPFDGSSESGGMCGAAAVAVAEGAGPERQRAVRQDDELGSNNRLRLNDLHGVSRGPGGDTLILRRKPFNTKTLAYVYNTRTNQVQPLLRKTHFGILGKAYDVPMVRYFPNMRMRTWLRRVRGRPARAPPRESDLQTVQGGYIALARNKLVYVDSLNAGTVEEEEEEEAEAVEEEGEVGAEEGAAGEGEE